MNRRRWLCTALIGVALGGWPGRVDSVPVPQQVEREIQAVLGGLQSPGSHASQEPREPMAGDLAALMQHTNVPGLSISVIHGFQIRWTRAYGVADVERQTPVTPQTLFQAASISKPVMAIAAARLAEQGRIDLMRRSIGHCGRCRLLSAVRGPMDR